MREALDASLDRALAGELGPRLEFLDVLHRRLADIEAAPERLAYVATFWRGEGEPQKDALAPPGHAIDIHLTMTDDYPWAQAFVILTARKMES